MCITYKNNGKEVCLHVEDGGSGGGGFASVAHLYQQVEAMEGIPRQHFYLTFNGRCLDGDVVVHSPCHVAFHLRLPGGKVCTAHYCLKGKHS